jgi:RNA polymerase-binding transcription factor DksA
MADEADIANDFIDSEVTRALAKIRQNQKQPKNPEAKICEECGEKIPDPRLKLGFVLCIECAKEMERRESLFANQ